LKVAERAQATLETLPADERVAFIKGKSHIGAGSSGICEQCPMVSAGIPRPSVRTPSMMLTTFGRSPKPADPTPSLTTDIRGLRSTGTIFDFRLSDPTGRTRTRIPMNP
jgi:hypothetical protein